MESRDRDRLDQWLDAALRQNALAEPRPGLEGRVLARIAAESKRHRTRTGWAWIFATATIVALVGLIGLGVGRHPGKAPHRAALPAPGNSVVADVQERAAAPVSRRPAVRHRSHRKPAVVMARTREEPKLERFPSPRPRSREEVALESYAQRFPAEAALIAQEQRKFDLEIAKAQEETEKGSSDSNP